MRFDELAVIVMLVVHTVLFLHAALVMLAVDVVAMLAASLLAAIFFTLTQSITKTLWQLSHLFEISKSKSVV